jgi:hypothetical protein
MASVRGGFEHWLHCHQLFEEDRKYLTNVYRLTYEAYISNPPKYHKEIAQFIGTDIPEVGLEEVTGSHNKRYFDLWIHLLTKSPFRSYYQYIARKYEARFSAYGYSLLDPAWENSGVLSNAVRVPDAIAGLLCAGADLHAFTWRLAHRGKGHVRRTIRRLLPPAIKERVKQLTRVSQRVTAE